MLREDDVRSAFHILSVGCIFPATPSPQRKPNKDRFKPFCVFNPAGGLRGATVVDSLDTLYVMELHEEFQEAKNWVEENFDLNVVSPALNALLCAAETAWGVYAASGGDLIFSSTSNRRRQMPLGFLLPSTTDF